MSEKLRRVDSIHEPTGHARRTVEVWPKADRIDEIVKLLRTLAEQAPEPEQRTILQRPAGLVGGMGRDVLVGVLTSAAGG
jgi:hypothetical protein